MSTFLGRTLDVEHRYNETVTFSPRNFRFKFRNLPELCRHHAMLGMAYVASGFPLYYDAINEHGLFAAALNFPESGLYKPKSEGMKNIASFELIPYILGTCSNICEVKEAFEHTNITDENFRDDIPARPLHWFIGDKNGVITVEQTEKGLRIFDNPAEILTNEPPFGKQYEHWKNFLSTDLKNGNFQELPGDFSSGSRFIKAAFLRKNSVCGETESEGISQFFSILSAVSVPRGSVRKNDGALTETVYSSCANAEKGIYYYRTSDNSRITALSIRNENPESDLLISYPLIENQDIFYRN